MGVDLCMRECRQFIHRRKFAMHYTMTGPSWMILSMMIRVDSFLNKIKTSS